MKDRFKKLGEAKDFQPLKQNKSFSKITGFSE